ncbi:MAG: hypothetical protein WCD38_12185, partial [Candidatus Tumulicola sp.]
VVEQTPLPLCLLDNKRKILIASEQYIGLVERNNGALPAVGEAWKRPPRSIELTDAGGSATSYRIEQLSIPQDGSELIVFVRR